jgi:type II secretory pathway pseudopilin PulG
MGLLRMAARTAVVAGTATAVSGRVQRRQAARYDQQDQQQYEHDQYQQQQQYEQQQQYAQQQYAQAPPPPPEEDPTEQLAKFAKLHDQGVLTDEEFAAAKAKVLGI